MRRTSVPQKSGSRPPGPPRRGPDPLGGSDKSFTHKDKLRCSTQQGGLRGGCEPLSILYYSHRLCVPHSQQPAPRLSTARDDAIQRERAAPHRHRVCHTEAPRVHTPRQRSSCFLFHTYTHTASVTTGLRPEGLETRRRQHADMPSTPT